MSRWYRRYVGTVSDPKIAEAAMIAGCSRAVVVATWDMILESAAEQNGHGEFRATPRNVAATLGEQVETICAVFSAIETLEMISGGVVCSWSKRQFQSDSSTERSRKHRASKRGNGDATLQRRCATPPESESDTDSDTESVISRSEYDAAREERPTDDDPNFEKCKRAFNGSTHRIIDGLKQSLGVYGTRERAADALAAMLDEFGRDALFDAFRFAERCEAKGQQIRNLPSFLTKNARRYIENEASRETKLSADEQRRADAFKALEEMYQ